MRIPTLLAAFSLTMLAPAALAHLTHPPCYSSVTIVEGVLHVDVYRGSCTGVTVSTPIAECNGLDIHIKPGIHVLILYQPACQTGVVIETLRAGDDAPLHLLP